MTHVSDKWSPAVRDELVRLAAANNAVWCNIVCQANDAAGIFKEQYWRLILAVPMYYPNMITLTPGCSSQLADSVVRNIQGNVSIKDSFDALRLPDNAYEKLFEGQWFVVKAVSIGTADYRIVKTREVLSEWEKAMHREQTTGVFNYKLLFHPAVRIIAIFVGENITGGCVLTKSKGVVGLTNFFSHAGEPVEYWSICLAAAHAFAGNAPVVGIFAMIFQIVSF